MSQNHQDHQNGKKNADDHKNHKEHGQGKHDGHSDGGHSNHHAMMAQDFKRRFWISLVLTLPMLVLSPMLQDMFGFGQYVSFPGSIYVLLALATAVYAYGGLPFIKGLVKELGKKKPGMMTLIGLAISVAYFYSAAVALGVTGRVFFWELATLIDVMLLGHWIEMKSVMSASGALDELVRLLPSEAHRVLEDGDTEDVPVEKLSKGDRFQVRPGEKFPTDGRIVEGKTQVDEAMVTGESKPVKRGVDDEVIGGTVNQDGSVIVKVEKEGGDTFLNQVIDTVRKAQESKSETQNLADKAAFWLTIIAVSAGLITLTVWLLVGREFVYAMERMVTVMVITCPHALGLAIPLVVAVTTSLGASHGLLIRNRSAFEQARNLNVIAFDKTGTLTEGKFGLAGIVPLDDTSEDDLLKTAASLESMSEHPLGRAIVAEAEEREIKTGSVQDFEAMKGRGIKGTIDGREWVVVSPGYLEEKGISYDRDKLAEHFDQGRTVVFLASDGKAAGAFALGDSVREESREAVSKLDKMGIKTVMITGDREEVAKSVADTLGLKEYHAEVLPDDKADIIKKLKKPDTFVGMTGDGVNDAPALATADLGIAVGAGTDVAIETADVVLVRSNPLDVVKIIELSRSSYRKMIQNLFWATGYNVVAIPLAAGVLAGYGIVITPALGAALMSVSTVVAAVNSRLLKLD